LNEYFKKYKIEKSIQLDDVLGQGGQGTVYKGLLTLSDSQGVPIACKQIKATNISA